MEGAEVANSGRNFLRILGRYGFSGFGLYPFGEVAAKYGYDWGAVISAAGRTNPAYNQMGVVGGGAAAAYQGTQCLAGQPGC